MRAKRDPITHFRDDLIDHELATADELKVSKCIYYGLVTAVLLVFSFIYMCNRTFICDPLDRNESHVGKFKKSHFLLIFIFYWKWAQYDDDDVFNISDIAHLMKFNV